MSPVYLVVRAARVQGGGGGGGGMKLRRVSPFGLPRALDRQDFYFV